MKKSSVIATMMMTLIFALVVVAVLIASGVFGSNQIKLVFSSGDALKEYDGTPLTNSEWEMLSGELKEGHRAEVTVHGTQTDVGESRNLMTVKILDKNGKDVTSRYSIECQSGTLRVSAINIVVESLDLTKEYDAEPLLGSGAELKSGNLLPGHEITITSNGSQTTVGESRNGFEILITNTATGENVTHNYSVKPLYGKLKVTPIDLTIRTGSASKDYDGYPLSYDFWENLTPEKLLDGHELIDVELLASIVDPGFIDNVISSIKVVDGNGNDVSSCYDYSSSQYGILVVNGLGGGSGSIGGPPSVPAPISGPSPDNLDNVVAMVKTNTAFRAYLWQASYGNYTGDSWLEASAYDKLIDGKYSAHYLSALALKDAGYISSALDVLLIDAYYMYPTYMDAAERNYTVQTDDTYCSGDEISIKYSMYNFAYEFSKNGYVIASLPDEYKAFEEEYREFVERNYKDVPTSTAVYLNALITTMGFDTYAKDDPELIAAVVNYIQNSAAYNLYYDRALDDESDIVVAFLSKYKEGICQHYASAATLMFRQLGIPARYSVGYAVQTVAGEWTEVKEINCHAWVEIYINGTGWVAVEVTGSRSGNPTPEPPKDPQIPSETKVVVQDQYHKYDGTEFSVVNQRLNNQDELEDMIKIDNETVVYLNAKGYTMEFNLVCTATEVGFYDIELELVILNDLNEDITHLFNIVKITKNELQIYEQDVIITSGSTSKPYDDTALTYHEYTVNSEIDSDSEIKINFVGSIVDAGRRDNAFSASIVYTENGERNPKYKVSYQYGTLEITKRVISLTANSAMKSYDGTPLTDDGFTVDGDLYQTHNVFASVYGELTECGEVSNTIDVETVIIMNSQNKNVTNNYIIRYYDGKLIVYYGDIPPELE